MSMVVISRPRDGPALALASRAGAVASYAPRVTSAIGSVPASEIRSGFGAGIVFGLIWLLLRGDDPDRRRRRRAAYRAAYWVAAVIAATALAGPWRLSRASGGALVAISGVLLIAIFAVLNFWFPAATGRAR